MKLFIDYLFHEVKLRKITAGAPVDNVASIVTLKKLGFTTERVLRNHVLVAGTPRDVVRLALETNGMP